MHSRNWSGCRRTRRPRNTRARARSSTTRWRIWRTQSPKPGARRAMNRNRFAGCDRRRGPLTAVFLEPWRGLWRLARRIVEAFGNKQRGKRQPSNGIAPKLKRTIMPKKPIERARQDEREGKAPSTQAGEFVREEIELIREGAHGARSTKQAIAIGLSKARRAGVKLPPPKKGTVPEETREKAKRDLEKAQEGGAKPASRKRSP